MNSFYYEITIALKNRTTATKDILVEVEFDVSDSPDYWEHEAKAKEYIKENHPSYSMSSLKKIDGYNALVYLFPNQRNIYGL